jgi:hypothetical protein
MSRWDGIPGLAAVTAAMFAVLGIGAAHLSSMEPPDRGCAGPVVTAYRNDPVTCDLVPGQRLDIIGITRAECDDAGGAYLVDGSCRDADF